MNIIYITRHFNHSGYEIFRTLIERNIQIKGVILQNINTVPRTALGHCISSFVYKLKCLWYRCDPLKNTNSEVLLAKKHKIPIIYLDSIRTESAYNQIKAFEPDLIVLGGGWHELLPQRIYSMPRLGCINTHPSLLPEFRGTAVHRWQILNGIQKSGVTIHYVNSRFDAGEILVSEAIEVNEETTPQELFSRTARVAAETMPRLIAKFSEFGSQPTIQREGNPVFCKYYSKWSWNEDELRIKWNSPLRKIHFHVLANTQESYEYAGPWFLFKGRRYILRKTRIHDRISTKSRGNNCLHCDTALFVVDADETSIFLGNKIDPDILELVQVQRDDRFRQFRRAYPATTLGARPGDVFCSMKEA